MGVMAKNGIPSIVEIENAGRWAVLPNEQTEEVVLWSILEEYPAGSKINVNSYEYTNGGNGFKRACDIAKEIASKLGWPT